MLAPTIQSELRRFAFKKNEALRRDAQGHRVVADVEGPAILTLLHAETPVTHHSGERIVPGQELSLGLDAYAEFLAEGEGMVETLVQRGPIPTALPPGVEGTNFHGVGWLTEWDGLAAVVPAGQLMPYRGRPMPFLLHAAAPDGGRAVMCDDVEMVHVASLAPDEPDTLKAVGFSAKNLSAVETLKWRGGEDKPMTLAVASHLNQATFTVEAPPGCMGLLICQRYDRFHGVQRVRVLANGEFVGWWYEPVQNRDLRWGSKQFGIPLDGVGGPVEITLDPPAGAPLWSFGPTKVWAMVLA